MRSVEIINFHHRAVGVCGAEEMRIACSCLKLDESESRNFFEWKEEPMMDLSIFRNVQWCHLTYHVAPLMFPSANTTGQANQKRKTINKDDDEFASYIHILLFGLVSLIRLMGDGPEVTACKSVSISIKIDISPSSIDYMLSGIFIGKIKLESACESSIKV